jgi:cyclopropane fatty-acyl-phospholipid synthase-like methyltransferase
MTSIGSSRVAALILGLVVSGAGAQQRTAEEYARILEGAERVAKLQVPRVVETLGLKPGGLVADLGSGSGLFTRPIARAVAPNGIAYAVDIDEALLTIVERSAREAGLGNVRTVLAAPDDPKLPQPVDLVFICDALHHFGDKPAYLKMLPRYVTPGGRIAVIDFEEDWPAGHDRMRYTPADLDTWMKAAGFTRVGSYDFLENSFFVLYRRQ